jgi:hypothetical protein
MKVSFTSPILEIDAQTFNMLHWPSAGWYSMYKSFYCTVFFSTERTFVQNMRHDNRYTATHSGIHYPWNMSIYDMCLIWSIAIMTTFFPPALSHLHKWFHTPQYSLFCTGPLFWTGRQIAWRWLQPPLPTDWSDDGSPYKAAPF